MRYLITGGYGFIGSNYIEFIYKKYKDKVEIINLDYLGYGSNKKNVKICKNYKFYKVNLSNKNKLFEILEIEKPDIIVHFAAETHVDRSISNPDIFLKSNIIGTFNILEYLRKTNEDINFVHISTDEVYGDASKCKKIKGFSEDDPLIPSSPYSATKAASDLLVLSFIKTYGINAKITRCTNNFGPKQNPEKLIPKTIIRALKNLKIPIYGNGQQIRDWLYVEDHCRAIDLVTKKGKKGEIYNISSKNEITNIEVVKKILSYLNKDEKLIEFVEDRPGHDFKYSLDNHKIISLGWSPKYSFEEALKKTVDWYLNNKDWWSRKINKKILHPTPWKLKW